MQLKTDKNSPHTPRKNSTWKENTQILFKIHDWQHDVEEINQSNICRKWFIEKDQWKKWDKPTALVQAFGSDVCRPFWLLRWSSILSLEKAFFSLSFSLPLCLSQLCSSRSRLVRARPRRHEAAPQTILQPPRPHSKNDLLPVNIVVVIVVLSTNLIRSHARAPP